MKIIVRTWHKTKVEGQKKFQDKMFLETVELPKSAVLRIREWGKEYQVSLLNHKYNRQSLDFIETQRQNHLVAMNKLYKQLQSEGLNSQEERLAIGFLFKQQRDNPELIDLETASHFLTELEAQAA